MKMKSGDTHILMLFSRRCLSKLVGFEASFNREVDYGVLRRNVNNGLEGNSAQRPSSQKWLRGVVGGILHRPKRCGVKRPFAKPGLAHIRVSVALAGIRIGDFSDTSPSSILRESSLVGILGPPESSLAMRRYLERP